MEGNYFFLSNFYPCDIEYNGYHYGSVEAAFQAQKCPGREQEFVNLNPSQAKRLGRRVRLRSDWEHVKIRIMWELLCYKFSDRNLMGLLLQVNGPIVEDNTWGDRFWGKCKGEGKNYLGLMLEKIRDVNKLTDDLNLHN